MIQRQGDGFPLDQSRVAYLRYLRRERRQSPQSEARVRLDTAKARDLEIRNGVREGKLMLTEGDVAFIDELCGVFLTGLSGLPAQCTRDVTVRRSIEAAIFELRRKISETAAARVEQAEAKRHAA